MPKQKYRVLVGFSCRKVLGRTDETYFEAGSVVDDIPNRYLASLLRKGRIESAQADPVAQPPAEQTSPQDPPVIGSAAESEG